jgi:hypothetical protein
MSAVAPIAPEPLDPLEARFREAWPAAQRAFSPFTRLLPPIYCRTTADEKREGLEGSFAMIRMRDDRIVISLRQIAERKLERHALAILAHEVGHYVHAPGSLLDCTRLLDRIRRTVPHLAQWAAVISNLYTDLLLNDRLQRSAGIDVAAVYADLRQDDAGPLWQFYVRIYERLWRLPTGTLCAAPATEIDADAELGARLVRLFRDRWLEGAPAFAKLCAPYFENLPNQGNVLILPAWLDTAAGGAGGTIPDGLVDDDFDPSRVLHPALDDRITGDDGDADAEGDAEGAAEEKPQPAPGRSLLGDGRPDRRKVRRGPAEYLELLKAVGVERSPKELLCRYYRELGVPHVIPFPAQRIQRAGDPLPEGLDAWEVGSPLERIDWLESLLRSPIVVPGVTTVERSYGVSEGGEPERRPPDLYVGIDCSGSMGNPAHQLSFPVVAGVVLALSALRAGAAVRVCLSGEWHGQGQFVETPGFVRNEGPVLGVLTDYLGTGCSFGLGRLASAFAERRKKPAHVLIVSDSDLFREIDGTEGGWDIARRAIENAGGGASAVLRLGSDAHTMPHYQPWLARLEAVGFTNYLVSSEEELVAFARAFSRRTFAFQRGHE